VGAGVRPSAGYAWPGNVDQLRRVVTDAARRTDVIHVRHLPSEFLSDPSHHPPRIRAFERDKIVRVLTERGTTMRRAAAEPGMSRATLYRKMSKNGIRISRDRRQ